MGKKAPTPPPAPDPTAVANAQSAANIASATAQQKLNMLNTRGPYGDVNYAADPNAPGGYSQTTTLSPDQQHILDAGSQAQIGALGVANDQIGRVAGALNNPLDPSGVQSSFNQGGALQTSFDPGAQVQTGFNQGQGVQGQYQSGGQVRYDTPGAGEIQRNFDQGQGVQGQVAQSPGLQYGFNPGQGVQGHVGPQNLTGAYQDAANASYGQAASRLDPQWDQSQKREETQLANQGLSQDSDAYKNAMAEFNRNKTDAYNQANFSSQAAGLNAENTIFGQSVQQGQFANNAAAQQYGQSQGQAQFYNSAAGQQFGQNATAMQLANAAAGQQYSQNLGAMQAGNQAQAQQDQQNLAHQSAYNSAVGQSDQMNQSHGTFANAAGAQQYAQNMGSAQFNNAGAAQQYAQNQGQAAFNNTTAGQQYQQNQGAAQFGNQANNQQFQQNAYAGQLPINEFNALMSSGQVGMPQGVQYTPSQVGQTDTLGAYALNAQAAQAAYNSQMQNQNSMLGGLAQLGGAAITKWSDTRLKRDVELIGRETDGLGVYRYRYLWDDEPQVGVMAQEAQALRPHAVVETPSGFLAVDYGRL